MDVSQTPSCGRRRLRRLASLAGAALGITLLGSSAQPAAAAEASYPFEGTWVQTSRPCVANSTHARTYTAKEVVSASGRCSIRRVAGSQPLFELLEDCRRNERTQTVTETLHMTSPDTLSLKRQLVRLKIPRQLHYARCSVASPFAPHPARPATPAEGPEGGPKPPAGAAAPR